MNAGKRVTFSTFVDAIFAVSVNECSRSGDGDGEEAEVVVDEEAVAVTRRLN